MSKFTRRTILGFLTALPAAPSQSFEPLSAHPEPLDLVRKLYLKSSTPAAMWSDIDRPDDISAMRRLIRSLMGDIHKKPAWSLGWGMASRLAYHTIYKPFGFYMPESNHFAELLSAENISRANMAALQRVVYLCSCRLHFCHGMGQNQRTNGSFPQPELAFGRRHRQCYTALSGCERRRRGRLFSGGHLGNGRTSHRRQTRLFCGDHLCTLERTIAFLKTLTRRFLSVG